MVLSSRTSHNWQVHSDKFSLDLVCILKCMITKLCDKGHVSEMLRAMDARGKEKRIAFRSRGEAGADRRRREGVSAWPWAGQRDRADLQDPSGGTG